MRRALVTEFEQGQSLDASYYESILPSAIKVSLAEGEKKVQDVRIASGG